MFEQWLDVECACGKKHSLTTRDFFIERDAYANLPALLEKLQLGSKPLAVFDSNTYKAAHGTLEQYLPDTDALILQGDDIHADEKSIEAVAGALAGHSVILAVGAGVINDVTRYVSFKEGVPFISMPTAASVDGFVANAAVVTLNGMKRTMPAAAPVAVVADLDIIAAAPAYLAASGVGDMLSKYISIADWKVGSLIAGEYYCSLIAQMELDALALIAERIDGIAAGDPESIGKLMEGLVISGLAIQMASITRPASSFEHHFSHYLEVVPLNGKISTALHGEKVGIASLIAAKYYPLFAHRLERIFRENLPNRFSGQRIREYYSGCPDTLVESIIQENTPNISCNLDVPALEQHYSDVVEIADGLPSPDFLHDILKKVGGMTDYRELGMTPSHFRKIMKSCCYIRNRFTLLRLMSDYELFDFDMMDD